MNKVGAQTNGLFIWSQNNNYIRGTINIFYSGGSNKILAYKHYYTLIRLVAKRERERERERATHHGWLLWHCCCRMNSVMPTS